MANDDFNRPVTKFLVDPQASFASVVNAISRAFPARFDEAMKDQPDYAPKMLRDCFIFSKLQERILPVARSNWELCPVDESQKGPIVDELKKKYTRLVKSVPGFLKLRMNLLKAIWFGKYAAQIYPGKNNRAKPRF